MGTMRDKQSLLIRPEILQISRAKKRQPSYIADSKSTLAFLESEKKSQRRDWSFSFWLFPSSLIIIELIVPFLGICVEWYRWGSWCNFFGICRSFFQP